MERVGRDLTLRTGSRQLCRVWRWRSAQPQVTHSTTALQPWDGDPRRTEQGS